MTYQLITISGEVCSGKSSVANALLALLPDWNRLNTGQKFRDFCAAKGMSIQQVAELPDEVHREFDAYQKSILESEKNMIVEGRLAGWLARDFKNVFRVFCFASLEARIERCMARDGVSKEQSLANIEHRDTGDVEKFKRIYGMTDYRRSCYYHLMLDTTTLTPSELAGVILEKAGLIPDERRAAP